MLTKSGTSRMLSVSAVEQSMTNLFADFFFVATFPFTKVRFCRGSRSGEQE